MFSSRMSEQERKKKKEKTPHPDAVLRINRYGSGWLVAEMCRPRAGPAFGFRHSGLLSSSIAAVSTPSG